MVDNCSRKARKVADTAMPFIVPDRAVNIDYNYSHVPALSEPRIIEQGRVPAKHNHFNPKYYKFIFVFFMVSVFGSYFAVPLGSFVATVAVNYFFPLPWYVIGLALALPLYRTYRMLLDTFNNIIKQRLIGHEFHENPSIKDLPNYKNSELMWLLWVISPYRKTLLRTALSQGLISQADYDENMRQSSTALKELNRLHAEEDNGEAEGSALFPPVSPSSDVSPSSPSPASPASSSLLPSQSACYPKDTVYFLPSTSRTITLPAPIDTWDRPEEATFYQPSEGFCGPATLNTVNYSLYGAELLPLTRIPIPLSIHEVVDIYSYGNPNLPSATAHTTCVPKCQLPPSVLAAVRAVTPYYCNDTLTYPQFLSLLQQSNSSSKRILCNFLRAPLFNPRPGHIGKRSVALMGGHWSPIAAYEPHSHHVLVLDVNSSYGCFLVHAYLLYKACFTKDGNKYRGLILLDIVNENN